MTDPHTILRLSRGYYRGFFALLRDRGDQLDLRRVERVDGRAMLGEYVTIRRGSHCVVRPRQSTLKRRGIER